MCARMPLPQRSPPILGHPPRSGDPSRGRARCRRRSDRWAVRQCRWISPRCTAPHRREVRALTASTGDVTASSRAWHRRAVASASRPTGATRALPNRPMAPSLTCTGTRSAGVQGRSASGPRGQRRASGVDCGDTATRYGIRPSTNMPGRLRRPRTGDGLRQPARGVSPGRPRLGRCVTRIGSRRSRPPRSVVDPAMRRRPGARRGGWLWSGFSPSSGFRDDRAGRRSGIAARRRGGRSRASSRGGRPASRMAGGGGRIEPGHPTGRRREVARGVTTTTSR